MEAWNQLRFWIVVGLQYSRIPVTRTLYNSNLPLNSKQFSFPLEHFLYNFTLDNSNMRLYMQICLILFSFFFGLIETKWSKFTILSQRWISRLRLELMHCTSYKFAFETWTGMQILKHRCHAIAQMLLWIESFRPVHRWSEGIRWKYGYHKWKKAGVDV